MTDEMPNLPDVPCQCATYALEEADCICGASERVLRSGIPLTGEQREWCLNEIARVEGYDRKDYQECSDKDLGRAVLSAWTDYCRDQGMM